MGFIVLKARHFYLLVCATQPSGESFIHPLVEYAGPNWHPIPALPQQRLAPPPPRLPQLPALVRSTVGWFDLWLRSRMCWFEVLAVVSGVLV